MDTGERFGHRKVVIVNLTMCKQTFFCIRPKSLLVFVVLLTISLKNYPADNVILITLDGLRWQEVFRGLDVRLASNKEYVDQSELLMNQFWRESEAGRAETLLPFLHNTVFSKGSYVGNRSVGSCAAVSNPWHFSYPGYSEILSGVVSEAIDSNSKIPNPETTVLEFLDKLPDYQGKTAAFASWDVFPYIFNVARSGLHVNAYGLEPNPADDSERFLNNLYLNIPTPWPTVRNDAFTHQYAIYYLRREKPRFLYIGYGETDDFAHDGKYDEYILAAHRTDQFIQEIWDMVQSTNGYRDNTVLFVTVDHGRGEEPIETWMHHASGFSNSGQYKNSVEGSEAVWMAAIGPGIATAGLIETGGNCLTSNRIAATLLEVLGEDYQRINSAMGAPLQEFLE